VQTVRQDREPDEIVLGWLHLIYHAHRPELYTPSRANQVCRFCRELAGA
jgi:hypothetical protein